MLISHDAHDASHITVFLKCVIFCNILRSFLNCHISVISEEIMVNHFLPGLRCLRTDMEHLSPEHEVGQTVAISATILSSFVKYEICPVKLKKKKKGWLQSKVRDMSVIPETSMKSCCRHDMLPSCLFPECEVKVSNS